MQQLMYSRASAALYAVSIALSRALLRLLTRWNVSGHQHIPPHGPLILVANHTHIIDPPVVAASTRRRIHPMAKRELFELPLVGRIFWLLGAFPVRRFSGDTGALRTAQRLLREGRVVLMFPEGTRSHGGPLQRALPGAGMVALMSGAPIVPVAISGAQVEVKGVLLGPLRRRRPRIQVTFGEPFAPGDLDARGSGAEAATDLMMRRIAALLPPSQRGVYGEETTGTIVVRREGKEPGTEVDQ